MINSNLQINLFFETLSSPGPILINFGLLSIRWYGILIAISVFIGLLISTKLASQRGIEKHHISDLLPILVFFSIISARIYYVAFEWRHYSGANFWSYLTFLGIRFPIPSILEIWGGGIAIHGALIGGSLAVFLYSRWRNINILNLMDILLPSVALGQAIGRWGNFFNNEAYGLPTELPWKLFIPYIYRPEMFINEEFFHPTFLYESIWDIFIFAILIFLFEFGRKKIFNLPKGALTFIYLISYSLGRFWIEGLRVDPLCIASIPPFCEGGIRMAQLVSVLLIALGTIGLQWIYSLNKKEISANK